MGERKGSVGGRRRAAERQELRGLCAEKYFCHCLCWIKRGSCPSMSKAPAPRFSCSLPGSGPDGTPQFWPLESAVQCEHRGITPPSYTHPQRGAGAAAGMGSCRESAHTHPHSPWRRGTGWQSNKKLVEKRSFNG